MTEAGSTAEELLEFFAAFQAVVEGGPRRSRLSPYQLVDEWRNVVTAITTGYDDDLDEYDEVLSVRDVLETALQAPSLRRWPAWRDLSLEIAKTDAILEPLLQRGPLVRQDARWWRARLPPDSGPDLSRDAASRYGSGRPG